MVPHRLFQHRVMGDLKLRLFLGMLHSFAAEIFIRQFLILGKDGEMPLKGKKMEFGLPRKDERLRGDQGRTIL